MSAERSPEPQPAESHPLATDFATDLDSPDPKHLVSELLHRSWLHRLFYSWEHHPQRGWWAAVSWIALISGLAFLIGLGSIGLVDETEPLFAEAARQMLVRDDWVTPYFNEATRFDKPPLIYWLMAIAYRLFGINEWAVRLPSALAALVLTSFVLYTLQRHGIPRFGRQLLPGYSRWFTAFLGAALTAFNLETLAWARIGVSDMLLSGCFGSALLTFFLGYAAAAKRSHWLWGFSVKDRWYLLSYLFIALAILAKGPVGIVLPGIIVLGFLIYVGQLWQTLGEMKLWRGLPLMALITLPWYILVIQANGEAYTQSFFGYHNFERFTQTVNNHGEPWYFYFLVVLVGFAPWSLFLPTAIARLSLWQRRFWTQQPRSAQLGIFATAWFVGVFVFFTIAATKLPSYVLPLIPAGAILVSLLMGEAMTRSPQPQPQDTINRQITNLRSRPGFPRLGWVNFGFALFLAIAIGSAYLWVQVIEDPAMPEFPQVLRDSGVLIWGSLISLEGAIAIFLLIRRRQTRWLWAVNLIGFVALLVCVLAPITLLMDQHRQAPLREMAAVTVQQRQPEEEMLMVAFEKPTMVFYTQQPLTFFRRTRTTLRHIEEFSLEQSNPETLLILTYPRKLPDLGLNPGEFTTLHQAGAYQLIRVPKAVFRQHFSQG